MTIGTSWATDSWTASSWVTGSWADQGSEPPADAPDGIYAADGSLNIRLNDLGQGLYSVHGHLRVDTTSTGPGYYGPSGAIRAEVSDNEVTPPSGFGIYTNSGGIRMTQAPSANYNNPGIYAKDGSYRVTVNVDL